jgi:glucokinase
MILAGDIGGTKGRLALFQPGPGRLSLVRESVFATRDFSGPEEAIQRFLNNGKPRIRIACLGVAGPVFDGRSEMTNLPWVLEADRIGRVFRIPRVFLLNDLQAMAYGMLFLRPGDYAVLNPDGALFGATGP